MIRVCLLGLCCLLIANSAKSQGINPRKLDYRLIDQHALQAPDSVTHSIDLLVAYLTAPARSDFEKVRSVYRWVTANIRYDYRRYQNNQLDYYDKVNMLANTFGTKETICAGYAEVFSVLCTEAGVFSKVINGYARNKQSDIGVPDSILGHAWNAVQIGHRWYLLDATWGVDQVTAGETVEVSGSSDFDFYFLADPKKLIFTHFPEDLKWQMLPQRITKATFDNLPFVYPSYYQSGTTAFLPASGMVQAKGKFIVTLDNKQEMYLTAHLEDEQGNYLPFNDQPEMVKKTGTRYEMEIDPQRKGTFLVTIQDEGTSLITYKVVFK